MQRFVISSLSVLLASAAIAPMAQAFDAKLDTDFSMQELRTSEMDTRNKGAESEQPFDLHKLRTAEFESRNKAGDRLSTTSLIEQRHQVLDRYGAK